MSSQADDVGADDESYVPPASEESGIRSLYQRLLEGWNQRDAAAYGTLFEADANVIGFDGSSMNGRVEIESTLRHIFTDHVTATYVAIVREVRFLTPEIAVLRAVVGMIPPGETDVNPAVNALQTLVARQCEGQWRIALFQNTPAQFHGRPEETVALTEELRRIL
jgi:uncharacterized protein (TIGR02246 family)